MRSALLHYWLVRRRGGERVLAELCRLLPEADIFTHAYRASAGDVFEGRRLEETFIARLPFARRHPEWYLPLMPAASRRLDLSAYDLIVSSESGPVKGVRKRPDQRHVCYCHTPMRYVWDLYDDYYRAANPAARLAMRLTRRALRRADLASAEAVDDFVANSHFVAERIKRIYGRDSRVIYPPVDVDFFASPVKASCRGPERPYYLFVGAAVSYKRRDLAEAACRRMNRRLIIAGGGSQSDDELRTLYAGAEALLFPGIEDFGIVPVEAQAAGTPVIAFGRGGALETVREGVTGLFFGEQTEAALCEAIEDFEGRTWSRDMCRENARRFGRARFIDEMRSVLNI